MEVDVFHVVECEWLPQHVFVEGASEVGVQKVTIIKCFTDDSPNEFEVLEVISIDVGFGWWLEHLSIETGLEESVVGVKHLSR